jgi:hypothetical protein
MSTTVHVAYRNRRAFPLDADVTSDLDLADIIRRRSVGEEGLYRLTWADIGADGWPEVVRVCGLAQMIAAVGEREAVVADLRVDATRHEGWAGAYAKAARPNLAAIARGAALALAERADEIEAGKHREGGAE